MGEFFDIAVAAVISSICTALNLVCEFWRIVNKKKAVIDPSKSVVVITGCDSGFGEMTALQLHKLDYQVVAACLSEESVKKLKGKVALPIKCDVTKEKDIENLVKRTTEFCTANNFKLWAVVNNAGIGTGGCLDWAPMSLYRQVLEVNLFGLIAVTKGFLPLLKANTDARVVNLSSIAGVLCGPKMTAYGASKHAVEGFAKGLRAELQPWGIRVCNVNPGFMNTPILPTAMEGSKKVFLSAPAEIREQYDEKTLLDVKMPNTEDPQVVIDDIIDLMADQYPPFNTYPGKAAKIMRHVKSLGSAAAEFVFYNRAASTPQPTAAALEKFKKQ